MKIICLYGKANIGKTTTLTMLANEIVKRNLGSMGEYESDKFKMVLNDGRIVCITTSGDTGEVASDNIEFVGKHNPDIWFTAMRTSGESTNLGPYFQAEEVCYYKKNSITLLGNVTSSLINKMQYENNLCDMKALLYQTI